ITNVRERLEISGQVTRLAFAPDGQRLAGASVDNRVRVWDTASGRTLFEVLGQVVAFSPDGQRLAFPSQHQVGVQGTGAGGDQVQPLWLRAEGRILDLVFASGGQRLIGASSPRQWDEGGLVVQIWEMPEGRVLRTLDLTGKIGTVD